MDTERQRRWDDRYLALSSEVGTWSKDPSTKVGAVLVRANNSIASTGFNGFPPGHDDSPELYANREYKYAHVVHAEVNAMSFCDRQPLLQSTLYTSFPVCPSCLFVAAKFGVIRVVHRPLEECVDLSLKSSDWVKEWTGKLLVSRKIAREQGIQLEEFRV